MGNKKQEIRNKNWETGDKNWEIGNKKGERGFKKIRYWISKKFEFLMNKKSFWRRVAMTIVNWESQGL